MAEIRTKTFAEQVYTRTLTNGIKVYVFPRPGIDSVFTQITVRTGSNCEGEFLGCGLSHFLEHMVFNGTENFPGESDIPDRVTALGGETNAYTSTGVTAFYIELSKQYAHDAMDMLTDMVARPTFPEERFKKEKDIILREVAMGKDQVGRAGHQALMEEIYHCAPMRTPIIGVAEKIAEVDRDLMVRYYNMRYAPCRTGIIVVGDVDPVKIADYAEKKIGSWRAGRMDEPVQTPEPIQVSRRDRTIYFADPMAHLHLCWRLPRLDRWNSAVAAVLMHLVGNMGSSRLVRKFTMQNPLADSIGFGPITTTAETEIFGVFADCKPENIQSLQDGVLAEIELLKTERIPQDEFRKIKKGVRRDQYSVVASNRGIVNILNQCFTKMESPCDFDEFERLLGDVTPEDVQDFAKKYLLESQLTVLRMLPKELEPKDTLQNQKSGTIEPPVVKTFPGGQRYIIMPDYTIDSVNFSIVMPGGKQFETFDEISYSELLKSVISCGTEDYTEEELDDLLDNNAINLSCNGRTHCFSLSADCLSEDFSKMMDVVTSVLTKPLLAADKIERERTVLFNALKREMSDPNMLAALITGKELYCDDWAFCTDTKRTEESLSKATPEKLRSFLKKLFVAKDTVLSIGGAISAEDAEKALRNLVDAIEWSTTPLVRSKVTKLLPESKCVTKSLRGKKQMVVRRDYVLPIDVEQEGHYVEYKLLNAINHSMSSRVFQEVREKRGLAYYAYFAFSQCAKTLHANYFAGIKPGEEKEVLALFEQNQHEIAENGYTREEFENGLRQVRLAFAKKLERPWEMAESCAYDEYEHAGKACEYWEDRAKLEKLTYEEFNETIKKWFVAPAVLSVIVRPEEEGTDH